jgi:hypothetical protein
MVDIVGIRHVMRLVMLKPAKDRILEVDTLGEQVLSRVRYGMVCLLIRTTLGCESCLMCGERHIV